MQDDDSLQTFFAVPIYNTWELMTCYVDSPQSRLLKNGVSLKAYGSGVNATVENCLKSCVGKGYVYCGVEYYSECYGSNVEPNSSVIAPGGDIFAAGCSFPCKGNPSEACGGSNRILVYFNNVNGNN